MAKTSGAAAKKTTGVAKQETTPELVILSPEQYEMEIEKKIAGEIQKYNLADAKIAELKEKYAGITVTDITDKAQVKVLKEALSDVVSTRTGIDKKRVDINAEYIRMQKAVNGEAKRLTDLILEVEQPLKDEKIRVDALEKEEKERKEKEEQEKLDNRVAALKETGMVFDGSFYSIANMSMDIVTIKAMKDSDFDFLVAKVGLEAERIRKENEEKERQRLEQEEIDRKEREEFEASKRKMDEEKAAFQKQQDDFAAQQRQFQQQQDDAKANALKELVSARTGILEALGFSLFPSQKQFIFQNKAGKYSIEEATLSTSSPEYWKGLITGATEEIKNFNIKQDEIIESENEQLRKDAIADQQRKDDEAKAEQERKAEEAKKAEEARAAALPDVEKVLQYVRDLKAVAVPTVTNEEMGARLIAITEMLEEMEKITVEELESVKNTAGE